MLVGGGPSELWVLALVALLLSGQEQSSADGA